MLYCQLRDLGNKSQIDVDASLNNLHHLCREFFWLTELLEDWYHYSLLWYTRNNSWTTSSIIEKLLFHTQLLSRRLKYSCSYLHWSSMGHLLDWNIFFWILICLWIAVIWLTLQATGLYHIDSSNLSVLVTKIWFLKMK